MSEKLLPVSVVAARLGCSVGNVYNLIARGELACIRTGASKGYMVPEEELARFVARRKGDTPPVRLCRTAPSKRGP